MVKNRIALFNRACSGQGTVEYALVTVGFLGMIACLGVLFRFLQDGALVQHALMSASHHLQAVSPGSIVDIFLF